MFERMIGLEVTDDALYTQYRAAMTPLLKAHGGSFVVDVRVAEVLCAPGGGSFNRLFLLRFPSRDAFDAFFADPEYKAVRERLFVPSVGAVSALGEYSSAGS
jgi:uncharacterized protein (DUF1330 family)